MITGVFMYFAVGRIWWLDKHCSGTVCSISLATVGEELGHTSSFSVSSQSRTTHPPQAETQRKKANNNPAIVREIFSTTDEDHREVVEKKGS